MSRWRPPSEKSSTYITPEGYKSLEQESKKLWTKRTEVAKAVAVAAAEGDRSENAEYIYRKKQLRELDRRITYLQKRMPALKIVSKVDNTDHIYFSAWVKLESETGEKKRYRIVGADEIDPEKDFISVDAPLAKALLGKQVKEDVTINTEQGQSTYYILSIQYN